MLRIWWRGDITHRRVHVRKGIAFWGHWVTRRRWWYGRCLVLPTFDSWNFC